MVKDLETQLAIEQSNLKEHLPQLYFKKALIEINLNRESMAIQDLKKCLKLDPALKPARTKLIDILLEKGEFTALADFITKDDQGIRQKIEIVKKTLDNAYEAYNKSDFALCLDELEEKVIPITPSNPNAYQLHLKCLVEIYAKPEVTENQQLPPKVIISDLNRLINLQPMSTLSWYESMANYLLYTEVQFDKSWLFVKNCLKIDNDFKSCGQISKFYVKFQKFLNILEEYSINNGHYYLVNDGNQNVNEDLNKDINFQFVNEFLLNDEIKVSKIEKKSIPSNIKNNYDYLLFKASSFLQSELGNNKVFRTLSFIIDLDRILCESFIQSKDYKTAVQYCSRIDDKNSPFLPKHIQEIDQLLAKKKYEEAQRILESFNANVRQSKLFIDRHEIIERYINQQRQQQQQQQQRQRQQQQQQQQRQWQQRQQQQRQRTPPPSHKPTTDYYKILDISRDADDKTIKKAYRTQTLKYHPDKYKGNDLTPGQIENKMQDINQAYEVLADKELRERYDRGDDPNDPLGSQRQQHHPFGGGRPFDSGGGQQFQFNFGQNDFMRQFMKQKDSGGSGGFGGFGFGGNNQRANVKKNRKKNK